MCYFQPIDDTGMSILEMNNFLNECKAEKKLKEENIKMKAENQDLMVKKNQLLTEVQDLENQKDDLTKKLYEINKSIEIAKNKIEESKKVALLPIIHKENQLYDLDTDFVRDIAKIITKPETIDKVLIKNLNIIDFINDDNTKSTKEMAFGLERNNNKVILRFDEDYSRYIQNEEYLNLNPCLEEKKEILGLNKLLIELKKLGEGRKNANEFSLLIDPIKAYKYLGINIFAYINDNFSKKNQDVIDSIIKSGVERDHICIEPENSKQLYKILVNQLLHENDLVVIPSVDILGDDYTDIINCVIDLFYKKANILIENLLIEYQDFESSDSISILNKINDLIDLKQYKTVRPVTTIKNSENEEIKTHKKKTRASKKTKVNNEEKTKEDEASNIVAIDVNKGVSDIDLDELE